MEKMTKPQAQNPDFQNAVRRFVSDMPIIELIGLQFQTIEPGEVDIVMPYRHELSFAPGAYQAGAIGTIMDVAASCAIATLLPANWSTATVDYTIKVLAPARGSSFRAHGRAVSSGKTLSVGEAQVYAVHDGISTHCASGMVTTRNFPLER